MEVLSSLCRLCGNKTQEKISIFDADNDLYFKITSYMSVKIIKDDPLPHHVCKGCFKRLEDFHKFSSEALNIQLRLFEMLNPNNSFKTEIALSPLNIKVDLDIKKEQPEYEDSFNCMDTYFDSSSDCEPLKMLKVRKAKKERKKTPKKIKKESEDSSVEEGETYTCCICFNKVPERSEMVAHYKQHISEISSMKDSDLIVERDRTIKIEDDDVKENFKCAKCETWFPTLDKIQVHIRLHKSSRPYRCSLCEKTFKNVNHIIKHSRTHTYTLEGDNIKPRIPEPRFICDCCDQKFIYMKSVLDHRSECHPDAPKSFVNRCMLCRREFAHLNSLRRHLRSHTGERNFLCNICGKKLVSQEHLNFHIRIHTGYKPYGCKTCGKAFVKNCNLKLHERVHSGEKPHVCLQCGKGFSQRSTLVIHERYHTGARPYSCTVCGKAFVARGLLTMHLKASCGV